MVPLHWPAARLQQQQNKAQTMTYVIYRSLAQTAKSRTLAYIYSQQRLKHKTIHSIMKNANYGDK